MSPPLATWKTKRPRSPGIGVGTGATDSDDRVGSDAGVGDAGLDVGVLVGGGGSVALGVGVAVQAAVGDCCWALVGKGMMVGSGGTSWPHAANRNTIATIQGSKLSTFALFTDPSYS
jgi:hypothetical protein